MHDTSSDNMISRNEYDELVIAAEAFAYAARTPGTGIKVVDGIFVLISGEVSDEAVTQFAAHAKHLDPAECAGFVKMFDGRRVRTFSPVEYAEYISQADDTEVGRETRRVGESLYD